MDSQSAKPYTRENCPGARTMSEQRLPARKRIALIAHDSKKEELLEWARRHRSILEQHELVGTGTTGRLVSERLGLPVRTMQSGPLGGDIEIGALIAQGTIDLLLFFWDPLQAQPHDPDVKALLRVAVLWNIPVGSNVATADFLFSSPFLSQAYASSIALPARRRGSA